MRKMALIRWTPGRDLVGIQEEMNRLFDNFFGAPRRVGDNEVMHWTPRVNVEEMEDRFEISAELPGLKKGDVKIEVKDHVLTLTGAKKLQEEKKEKNVHLFERSYGRFCRTFALPDNVDADKIEAAFEDGVLRIDVPKTEEAKPREIEVSVK
jgi:HSP20 family protein